MASGFRFRGVLTAAVDPVTLQAVLYLKKGGDLEYDSSAVLKVLHEAGIREGFEPEEVLERLRKFSLTKETEKSEVIAQGQLPQPPVPETLNWSEKLGLPEDLKRLALEVFKKAGHPVVYSAAKEKALVDHQVKILAFVEAGAVVATQKPAQAGKPGRDLAGQVVPPPPLKHEEFYWGQALVRKRSEISAEITGFLRVGKNWAELVPFTLHRWELMYSEDKTGVRLSFFPGDAQAPSVTSEQILAQLEASYPRERLIDTSQLDNWLAEAIKTHESFDRSLNKDRDGSFFIEVSPNRVMAQLRLEKPLGNGRPLSLKDLGQALRQAGLKGFSFESVKTAVNEFMVGPQTELPGLLLAEGKAPTRGADRQLEFKVDFLPSEEATPLFKALGLESTTGLSLAVVQQEHPVAVFETPVGQEGHAGLDVYGEKIPPIPGNDPTVELLFGLQRSGDTLEAVKNGLLIVEKTGQSTKLQVREHRDGRVTVTRAPDNLEAFLSLYPPVATGRPLTLEAIHAALKDHQVTYGLDEKALQQAFEVVQAGRAVEKVLIARGLPSSSDLERRLKFLVSVRKDPRQRLTGAVQAGEVVAEYSLPDMDQPDGVDVLGNVIPVEGEPLILKLSEHLKAEEKELGVQKIIAEKSGEILLEPPLLSLRHQIQLKNVDGRTGSVKFPGEVFVEEGVDEGLFVMAGAIKVKGQVVGALLSSDSNIQAAGVKGEGKALLRAKQHIAVGFAEKTTFFAVGDLHVHKSLHFCRVMCNGKLWQKNPGGTLVGGLIKVKSGLVTNNLGTPNGVPTTVSFGQDYLIEAQITAEVKETDKLRESIVKLDHLMTTLTSPADKDKLAQARKNKVLMLKLLEKRNMKLINLRDKFDLHCPSEIIIYETLYPGVSIESHGRLYEVKEKKTRLKIVFNENTGHIEDRPLDPEVTT